MVNHWLDDRIVDVVSLVGLTHGAVRLGDANLDIGPVDCGI